MTLKVLHLSTYGGNGGAGRAATALHQGMLDMRVPSVLRTASGVRFGASRLLDRQLWRLQRSPVHSWRSPARFGSLDARDINAGDADVVNLHWVTDGYLSIEEIGRIEKPVVWSLYDMWTFCGTEHYGVDTPQARWRTGYTAANRPKGEGGLDLDRRAWQRKLSSWGPMHVVSASTWLTDAARSSALMGAWPITQIPHVVDETAFAPIASDDARRSLGLEPDVPVITFLASAGTRDGRKGFDLLAKALPNVSQAFPDVRILVVGPHDQQDDSTGGVPISWLGSVHGDRALRLAYSAGDVIAVPSREDNMPLTAMEAQTCGRAVVAFGIGGLSDIVEHRVTGYLASPFDSDDLGSGLMEAIEDSRGMNRWGHAARERAVATWSPSVVVPQYVSVYEEAITK